MNNITSIHTRELDSIRHQFSDYFEEHSDETELDRLYHKWIPLLSTYVTHDSIETAIDDWYALIEHSNIWSLYMEETQVKSTRPTVINTLEAWKQPIIFAGKKQVDGTYKNWSDDRRWTLLNAATDHFIGIALPFPDKTQAVLQHYFEATDDFFNILADDYENSPHPTRELFLKHSYLTCLAHLSN
ncbi:hypothetical protein [Domibacillus epiphyticus]|uniref:Uncharacterized protein n=1 Tax=Domibacillus epiphyticus TaxID=1714355 RepID=A0A1V2A6C6_9BACI|nr:hypothetical protein [Domibacillus epiphyticus]OMP66480.1 hypothetical protein BTO28_12325 [Domibacillus epiphyticus]